MIPNGLVRCIFINAIDCAFQLNLSTSILTHLVKYGELGEMAVRITDLLFNLLLMLSWLKIWVGHDRSTVFNPYLVSIDRIGDRVLRVFNPLFMGADPRWGALGALLILTVFRALLNAVLPPTTTAGGRELTWPLGIGFLHFDIYPRSLVSRLVFSFLAFALFLFQIWGVSLILLRRQWTSHSPRAREFLRQLARPFSDAHPVLRPLVLFLIGLLIVALFMWCGVPQEDQGIFGSPLSTILALCLSVSAAFVDLLSIVQSLLFTVIIGAWFASAAAARSLATICTEWMDLLLGPLRKYPVRIGRFNLTPFLLLLAIGFIHVLLMQFLYILHMNLS